MKILDKINADLAYQILGVIGLIVIIALLIVLDSGRSLVPQPQQAVLNNSSEVLVHSAVPYAITNTTDIRVNNHYWYPEQCINFASKILYDVNTTTNTTTGTTKNFLSDVVIDNNTALQAYISVPVQINGTKNGEIMYEVFCNSSAKSIYPNSTQT